MKIVPQSLPLNLVLVLLLFPGYAFGSGIPLFLPEAWNYASLVVYGKPEEVKEKGEYFPHHQGRYRVVPLKIYQGEPTREVVEFYDFSYNTTASRHVRPGTPSILFLSSLREFDDNDLGRDRGRMVLKSMSAGDDEREEIEEAFEILQEYEQWAPELRYPPIVIEVRTRRVSDDENEDDREDSGPPPEMREFLIEQLSKENKYVHSLIQREILRNRLPEAIPYFQQKFSEAEGESQKLSALSKLRIFGEPGIREILISWLEDPEFSDKVGVIDQMIRLRDSSVIPKIEPFIDAKDEHVAYRAKSALLRFGDPRGKSLMFDILHQSEDQTLRYNAIFSLNSYYEGEFSEEEIAMILALQKDDNESVVRIAKRLAERRGLGD
ncbi:MAG: HEAT repeat domain-containing protein [Opitutales bacterium]|nr:HEAT repeat domain-containing protein [Opitutales bacterium]MCH8540010.1 HEAT repeat domain-containing protein [Opitutales bacterium]